MTKTIILLLLGVFLVSALETASVSTGEHGKLSIPLSSSVRQLELDSLTGKWYEAASSRQVRKLFQRDCQCLTSTFKMIHKNEFRIMNECLNKTTNKIVAVNGSLTQVMAESYPGAFHMEFKSENKSGASVVEAQKEAVKEGETKLKESNLKESKLSDSKDVKKEGTEIKKGDVGVKKIGEEEKGKEEKKISNEELAKIIRDKDINFLVLKNVDNKALLICGPTNNLIWVFSRTANLDESIFRSFNDEAKRLGFKPLVKAVSCPHSASQPIQH